LATITAVRSASIWILKTNVRSEDSESRGPGFEFQQWGSGMITQEYWSLGVMEKAFPGHIRMVIMI